MMVFISIGTTEKIFILKKKIKEWEFCERKNKQIIIVLISLCVDEKILDEGGWIEKLIN